MNAIKVVMLVTSLMLPIVSQATQLWSGCVTVVGVPNYMASNQVVLALSPGLPCTGVAGIPGSVVFTVGLAGITATTINSFLASALTAYTTGKKVMVYYDNATCVGQIIANGGYSGQC